MKVLLLGTGMQGRAALHDLVASEGVDSIVAADRDVASLRAWCDAVGYGGRVECVHVDAADARSIRATMDSGADVAIDLLPVPFIGAVAEAAVEAGVPIVNTYYVVPELRALADRAAERGVAILPEFGMDPGMDLVLLGHAVRSMDLVDGIVTYGAGFPEPEAAGNSIGYKVTWTFDGVLRSYRRAGRIIRGGRVIDIGEDDMFAPENTHEITIPGLGALEAFPNGDALRYLDVLGLRPEGMREMGRYVLRWPGHCAFWRKLVDLRLLDDDAVEVDGTPVSKMRFLAAALEPQLRYADGERDVVVVRIEVSGVREGRRGRTTLQVVDRRDLATGFTAMSRTVGFTASIGAQMLVRGDVRGSGLLSPVNDVPFDVFSAELARRGIGITSEFVPDD